MKRLAAATLILLAGCFAGERNEPLPNGYRVVELSRGTAAIITNDGDFAVYPNIVEHRVQGSLVIGRRVSTRDNTDGSAEFTTGLGDFTFDTSTGHLSQGLPRSGSVNGSLPPPHAVPLGNSDPESSQTASAPIAKMPSRRRPATVFRSSGWIDSIASGVLTRSRCRGMVRRSMIGSDNVPGHRALISCIALF